MVVLPTPFTPTNIHTFVSPAGQTRVRSPASSRLASSACSTVDTPSTVVILSVATRALTSSRMRVVVGTPTSARMRASSSSSQVSSSMSPPPRSPARAPANAARVLPRRSRRRGLTRPGSGSGSTGSARSGAGACGTSMPGIGGAGGSSSGSGRSTTSSGGIPRSREICSVRRRARRDAPMPRPTSARPRMTMMRTIMSSDTRSGTYFSGAGGSGVGASGRTVICCGSG